MIDPRVESVRASAYTVPTGAPEGDGTLAWDSTTIVLVEVRAGGRTGIGWTYGSPACATAVDDKLAGVVEGCAALDVTGAWEAMIRAVRNAGRPGAIGYAISAVDVALWDLKARLLGLPLHRLLGALHDRVPVYGSGGFTPYDDEQMTAQLTAWAYRLSMPRVKIKVAESWGTETARDLRRMHRAREIIGPDVDFYVDANGGYSRKQAIRMMREAADLDVLWVEEPVSSDDLGGLHEVREAVLPDVAAGEYGYDLVYFQRMCQAGAVDCLQADISRCGGITEWFRVAAVASAHGLEISGHCAPHLHAHAAAATPKFRHLEWFHDHVRIESIFFDGVLDPSGGTVTPDPDAPGHGLTFRRADAEPYRIG